MIWKKGSISANIAERNMFQKREEHKNTALQVVGRRHTIIEKQKTIVRLKQGIVIKDLKDRKIKIKK